MIRAHWMLSGTGKMPVVAAALPVSRKSLVFASLERLSRAKPSEARGGNCFLELF